MAGPAVQTVGYKELKAGLRSADTGMARELTKVQRELAQWLAPQAQAAAGAEGGSTRHFAGKISGRGTQAGARLEVASVANAAFWGAKQRTGWNAGNATANQKPWVGAGWDAGGPGGPYAMNPTIARNLPQIEERYGDGLAELLRNAFPDGGS